MNIAIYYFKPLYETRGGVGRVATWLARNLVADGHKVWCFVPAGFKVPGIECMGVSCEQVPTIEIPAGSSWKQHKFLRNAIETFGIDVVLNQCGIYKQSNLVMNCGAKVITTHHLQTEFLFEDGIPAWGKSWKFCLLRLLQLFMPGGARRLYNYLTYRGIRKIIRKTDKFTVLAESYRDWFVKWFPKYADRFQVVSNPIPFEHDDVSDFRKHILFVGRVDPEKRVERLIEVWGSLESRYKDWKLQIVGPGVRLKDIKSLVESKGLTNVEFTGRVDPRDYYSHASIICLTSDREGVPMVLREAMSYGIVPIVFDSFSAAREMIANRVNGMIVPAFDMDAYAAGLSDLIDGAAEKMREPALEAAKPYVGDKVFAKWRTLIAEVMT